MLSYQKLPQWLQVSLAFPLIFLNGWLVGLLYHFLQPISSIVITACLVTFLLDYPIAFLERRGFPRALSIGLVLVIAIALVGAVGFGLLPLVFQQLEEFVNRLPAWLTAAQQQVANLSTLPIFQDIPIELTNLTAGLSERVTQTLQLASRKAIFLAVETINSALNLLLILVLTILLVFSGESLWNGLWSWLPTPWYERVQDSLKQSFQSYFAGQAIVSTIQGISLMTVFLLLQIPFGLLFGLTIGFASLIPFGGTLTIIVISSLLALQNIWLGLKVLLVAIVVGKIIENAIAPRLMSGMTGLNPAIVFISVLTGSQVGGLLGLLLAVPIAGFIKRIADALKERLRQQEGSSKLDADLLRVD
ncbi:AI-2E family transporter [Chamaesiphon polymorphus]|uniref:AI-2E family transporter n=1 Tax=Chamaesiphon polymorphus CCALA 037 TaxID=2107692 RepID=A0A2T1GF84_9CYAN|nr:AI-2E family transporter [Chamaesiphon polymorphus]PSB56191.1 AI-2E family transporter [Chamaesiphon polymorphus CCALA 037]